MRVIDDIVNQTIDIDISQEEQKIIGIMKGSKLNELPPFALQVLDTQGNKGVLTHKVILNENDTLTVYRLRTIVFAPGVVMTGQKIIGPKAPTPVPFSWETVVVNSQKKALYIALLSDLPESKKETNIHLVN